MKWFCSSYVAARKDNVCQLYPQALLLQRASSGLDHAHWSWDQVGIEECPRHRRERSMNRYRTNCPNTLQKSPTRRLRSPIDELSLEVPTNTRSSVAFASSRDGGITNMPPHAIKPWNDTLGSAWNAVQGIRQRPGPWTDTESNVIQTSNHYNYVGSQQR